MVTVNSIIHDLDSLEDKKNVRFPGGLNPTVFTLTLVEEEKQLLIQIKMYSSNRLYRAYFATNLMEIEPKT